jgi:serine phosphatase RsbU (regulator of sigma subunit)
MKRFIPLVALAGGIAALLLLIPRFNAAQPGVQITRGEARAIADREATALGIPVESSWPTMIWIGSGLLDDELKSDPDRRRAAATDPVIGPRLGGYRVIYHRRGLEKYIPYGHVYIGGNGEILAARLRQRPETAGANPTEAELRGRADAFLHSRHFPGAPAPQFESARPSVTRSRTDWIFRYRVNTEFPVGNVVPYVWIYFTGDRFAGWDLIEEYADGSPYRGESGGEVMGTFLRFGALYVMLLVLLVIFLRKYHAGDVGVGTASFLFGTIVLLAIVANFIVGPSASEGMGFGSIDAQQTAFAAMGFKFLFVDLPLAVLVFFGWAVGESYARERWGERLASFDAILRRDPFNASVGRSLLTGIAVSPAIASAALLVAAIPLTLGMANPILGGGSQLILYLGGPSVPLLIAAIDSILFGVVAILFVLAFAHRRRMLWLGILVAAVLAAIASLCEVPMGPLSQRMLFGFGGGLAAVGVFLGFDLLAATTALFFGSVLTATLPLLSNAGGSFAQQMVAFITTPLLVGLAIAVAGLLTRRKVVYSYEDLAPHVRRIIERERVKAEIDAANRIQAALLPQESPDLPGASVASHYRAATEIGGDYFDFLHLRDGRIGIAFGDVAGHGLTSGIVMAMAKSALLVQVENDPAPRVVLTVLNDIVMKTAPKRMMMTFFFGLLDPASQTLRFSSAGHLDPYVFRAAKGTIEPLSSWGFPLGIRRREPFREHLVDFDSGDRLILYSDGLIEALDDDGEPFGFDRFEKTIVTSGKQSAEDIKRELLAAIRKFTRNRPPEDDQTLVVIAFNDPGVQGITIPVAAESVAAEAVH